MAAEVGIRRLAVVVFDGMSMGIMSFAFGVFDMAVHYGELPGLDIRVVAGEPDTTLAGGELRPAVPYDLAAIRDADLVIVPNWRSPGQTPPEPPPRRTTPPTLLLEADPVPLEKSSLQVRPLVCIR